MPLYEYRCKDCAHVTEVLQATSEKPLRRTGVPGCPMNNQRCDVERLLSAPRYNKMQGQPNTTRDSNGAKVTEHWDGRQDVTVAPKHIQGFSSTQP